MSSEASTIPKRGSGLKTIPKYFIHGFAFSIIFIVLVFVWALIFAVLIVIGSFIGFILGFIVLFFFLGGLNSFLTDLIWSIPIKTAWKSLLGHGFLLFILLIIVHIPAVLIEFIVPGLATTIVLFIFNAFIDGFVAKNVAGWWKKEGFEYAEEEKTPKGFLKKCVRCGREIPVASEQCSYCGAKQTEE